MSFDERVSDLKQRGTELLVAYTPGGLFEERLYQHMDEDALLEQYFDEFDNHTLGAYVQEHTDDATVADYLQELEDDALVEQYVDTGKAFGWVVSHLHFGQPVGMEQMLARYEAVEAAYAARGYRPISVDAFEQAAGWGKPLEDEDGNELVWQPLDDEEPTLHAQLFREHYLDNVEPAIDFDKIMQGETQVGEYVTPSTEALTDNEEDT